MSVEMFPVESVPICHLVAPSIWIKLKVSLRPKLVSPLVPVC